MLPDAERDSTTPPRRKLRVGVLLDSYMVPQWTYVMLERIARSHDAELSAVILNQAPRVRRSLREKLRVYWSSLFYLLYWRFEERFFVPRLVPNAFEEHDARDLLGDLPVVAVMPQSDLVRPAASVTDGRQHVTEPRSCEQRTAGEH